MSNIFARVISFIDKIGKPNFFMIVLILISVVVTGLYKTFSLYTESEGESIVGGLKTYKFILDNKETVNRVVIAGNSSKNIAITVSNKESSTLKYGIYYTSGDNLENVEVGYLSSSDYQASGLIEGKKDYIVTIRIKNHKEEMVTIDFGLMFGLENGGDLPLKDNEMWVNELKETKLSDFLISLFNHGSIQKIELENGIIVTQNSDRNILLDNYGIYHYYGEYPDNYIYYNDELWRILTVKNNRVKIVRTISIGEKRYHDNGIDSFVGSKLEESLNGINILASDSKVLIDATTYNIGSFNAINTNIGTIYEEEASDVYQGVMGLISAGDYVYATDLSLCKNPLLDYLSNSECFDTNWLPKNEWLISKTNNLETKYSVSKMGELIETNVTEVMDVYPTVELKENIIIKEGSGAASDPYLIEQNS